MIFKKTTAAVMAAAIMFGNGICAREGIVTASAEENRSGICAVTSVDVRVDADESSLYRGWLDSGDYIDILEEKKDSSGNLWYKIAYGNMVGYVPADSISVFSTGDEEKNDYENYLDSQEFPESYRIYLRELHRQHPNWVFTAQHIGIDWDEAVAQESVVGRNLVHSGAPESWKSKEKGAYDPETEEWYQLDSGGWVAASEDIIRYYLDPRNFLNDDYIFMFENLSYDANIHNIEGVEAILRGTFMDGDYTCPDTGETLSYAQTFMKAAEISGVSPYHLASRCRNEQGAYGAPQSLGTVYGYENYFNFFDVQAYATASMSAGQMGAKYATTEAPEYLLPWTNQYKSIVGGSIFLSNGYISKEQDTLYLQKFDMTDGGNGYFYHQYMTCVFGQANEAKSLVNAYGEDVLDSVLEFKIPVYDNMPDTLCIKPETEEDTNDLIDHISVSGATVSTRYNKYSSDLTASADKNTVTVFAAPCSANAKVYGTGSYTLHSGLNKIYVSCVSAAGTWRVYTIYIQNGEAVQPDESIDDNRYDINGDGMVNVTDVVVVMAHVSGRKAIDKRYYDRADVDGSGSVNVADGMALVHIIGLK